MKTPTIVAIFASSVWGLNSFAQSLYIPPYCENTQMDLQVRNSSAQATQYWLGWTNDQGASDEITVDVEGLEKSMQDLSVVSKNSSFKIYRPIDSSLAMKVRCHDSETTHSLTTRTSPVQEFRLAQLDAHLKISNLSWNENPIVLEWLNEHGAVLNSQAQLLSAKESVNFELKNPGAAQTLRIRAEFRILATESRELPMTYQKKTLRAPAAVDGAYFEMGLRSNPQAQKFIVYIDNPGLLAEARRLIQNPQIEKIVFGKIERGHGGYNVDLSDTDQSPWSWHYGKVTNIADFGSTGCNGTPEMLEDHLNSWLSANSYACFWSYRLLREIKLNE